MNESNREGDDSREAETMPATASPAPPPPSAPEAGTRLPTAALVTGLLALLVGIGALTAGYFIWHEVRRQADWQQEVIAQVDRRNQAMDQRLAALKARIDRLTAEAGDRDSEFRQALARLGREQEALASAISRLRARLGRRLEGWILAEAQYLLEIANQRLQLFHDIGTAKAALREADRRIMEADDPGLAPVREEIARELAALEAVALPDVTGLSTRLAALAGRVETLPLAGTRPPPAGPDAGRAPDRQPAETAAPNWRLALQRIWQAFRELVSIQRTDQPVVPLLPPKEQFFLRASLQLELDAARIALLREQPAAYRASLKRAKAWLNRYYDREDPGVVAIAKALDELMSVDIAPPMPDISGSARQLRDRLRALDAGEPPRPDAKAP